MTSFKHGKEGVELMRFVLETNRLSVGEVEIVVTLEFHGMKLRNEKSDADEDIRYREAGEKESATSGGIGT